MRTVALVPARGGSKSIPLKNIKEIAGNPLLYWGLLALENAPAVDTVYVATDSALIKEIALSFGFRKVVVYDRLPENAADHSSTEELMLECIERLHLQDEDRLLLLQVTTPYTTSQDVTQALAQYAQEKADTLLSCARTKRFIWNANGTPLNYDYTNRPRRQDFAGTLIENGAFYLSTVGNIRQSKCRLSGKITVYEMPEYTLTELDEPNDWIIAEALLTRHLPPTQLSLKPIKLFLSDIDGVLTDAGMYYSEAGDELKKFSTYDGKAFELIRNKGIRTGLITSENTKLNERRAQKIKVDHLYQGVADKLEVVRELCEQLNIDLAEVAYIGDDLGDVELLQQVGLAACPANAVAAVKNVPGILRLERKGGEGAVRELSEHILRL